MLPNSSGVLVFVINKIVFSAVRGRTNNCFITKYVALSGKELLFLKKLSFLGGIACRTNLSVIAFFICF